MTTHRPAALILFPGALGDVLCCWPAAAALRASGSAVTLATRVDLAGLLPGDGLSLDSIERREITDLFAASPIGSATRAYFAAFARIDSFTGAAEPAFTARLTSAAGGAVAVHAFRGMRAGESAVAYYARCLGVAPLLQTLPIDPGAAAWADGLWRAHHLGDRVLALHPGSGSVAKNWHGMAGLADAWRRHGGAVVALLGPAEIERGATIAADAVLAGESLPRVAAVVRRAARYVGNDSGISHLAGLVGARALVLFADSESAVWAPSGPCVTLLHAAPTCDRCGRGQFCIHRLPIARVLAALA
ncbi:hypothetical protein KF840_15090 [bacterium]|nr:hypothetical protein [bacterium]